MSLEPILLPIKDDLDQVEHTLMTCASTSVQTITQVVQYIILNGGKRIRPALTIFGARISGYRGPAAARIGAAMEMLHTASLLHDDVVDNAKSRRGQASANNKWGNQVSVLVGDFFWCKACQIIVDDGNVRILRAVTDAVIGTTEGEVLELTKSNDIGITEEEYLTIIRHKTAMLLAVSARAGAILGEVSEDREAALARYGIELGMAFQLADDALDYDCDEARLGKDRGTDLREGRLTLPLLYVLKQCTDVERAQIKEAILAQTLIDEDLATIVGILEKYGAIEYARARALEHAEKAVSHLESFKPSLERETMTQLAYYVVNRDT